MAQPTNMLTLNLNLGEAMAKFREYVAQRADREFRGLVVTKLDLIEFCDRCTKDFDFAQFVTVTEPENFAAKCKRMRRNAPTPCLCCKGECVG